MHRYSKIPSEIFGVWIEAKFQLFHLFWISENKFMVFIVFGVEAGDLTSTTTGLDLDSMLDRSDSDLSTNDARTIRKQLEGLENMYSEASAENSENKNFKNKMKIKYR